MASLNLTILTPLWEQASKILYIYAVIIIHFLSTDLKMKFPA